MFTLNALQTAAMGCGIVVAIAFFMLIGLRWRIDAHHAEVESGVAALEPVLQRWLVLDGELDDVRRTLRAMSAYAALRSLARLVTQQVPFERQQLLARALRSEAWVGRILHDARSIFWWRRFDAARLLSVVGREDDAAVIALLLDDSSPAVRLVAMDAAARLQARPLLQQELDTLHQRQDAVQAYQHAALARQPRMVAEALMDRLTPEAPVASLNSWIDTAGALASPAALDRVRDLASHPVPEIRVHVARALRRHSDPGTPPVLLKLLADDDWRVRAQASRALGALRCSIAINELAQAVRDRSWWVRYRSALALAQIGGPAREPLRELMTCEDPMARDMSTLVWGLSSAAVVEMSEV